MGAGGPTTSPYDIEPTTKFHMVVDSEHSAMDLCPHYSMPCLDYCEPQSY